MSDPDQTAPMAHGAEATVGGELTRGTRVGRLVLLEQVGEGGMGRVYTAYDPLLDRRVCLKFLKRDVQVSAEQASALDAGLRAEGRALARLSHPNILPLHDVGVFEDRVYLVTEFVRGWNLRTWREAEQPGPERILQVYLDAGCGLAAAHQAGVIHRDFKPDNVMLGEDGRVRVMDFGLATTHGTVSGDGWGTPRYMAPELASGAPATPASDQYAFAIALVEALSGDATERDWRASCDLLALNPAQQTALRRALDPDPAGRYADLDALLKALTPPQRRSPAWLLAGAGSLAAAIAAVLWWGQRPADPCADSPALMASVWSPAHAQRLRAQFARSQSPIAATAADRAVTLLDAQASTWVADRRSACLATRVDGSQSEAMLDRRMLCFDRRLRETDAVVAALLGADRERISQSERILGTLEPLASCSNLETLANLRSSPPTLAQRSEYERIDAELARLKVQFELGTYEAMLTDAEALLPQAQTLGHDGLLAHATYVLGLALEPADRLEEAARALESSFRQAVVLDDQSLLADTLGRLLYLASSRVFDTQELQRWIGWKQALEPLLSHDPLRWSLLDQEHGLALEPSGALDAAEALLRQARDRLVAQQGPRSPVSLRARGNHANALVMMGRHEDALPLLQALVEDHQAILGTTHPAVGTLLGNLSISQNALGQTDASLGSVGAALEIALTNHGDLHSEVGRLRINYASALNDAARFVEAEAQARQADAIYAERLGATHPWRLPAHSLTATALAGQGQVDAALAHMDGLSALGLAVTQLPPIIQLEWHVQMAGYADQLQLRGRCDAALAHAEALLDVLGNDPQAAPFIEKLTALRQR